MRAANVPALCRGDETSDPFPKAVAAIGRGRHVLRRIVAPGCAIAIWRRPLPASIDGTLAALAHDEIDDIDATIPLGDAALHVSALLGAAGYPAAFAVALAIDMAGLARCHAGLHGWPSVRMRLEWIETDACRRFHADIVETRLLTTYLGRGTQWRLASDADDDARELVAGDVAILKGRLSVPEAPILHRSPPICATGERRLLLVIDGPRRAGDPPV